MVEQRKKFVFFLIIELIINNKISDCANILCIFPIPSYSHQQPELAISHALNTKGHNLTVITANPSKVPVKNHRDIDLADLYSLLRTGRMDKMTGYKLQEVSTGIERITSHPKMMDYFLDNLYRSINLQNLIKEVNGTKYDLIICENYFGDSLLGFADLIGNPPIISISVLPFSSLGSLLGNSIIPSYIPSLYHGFSDRMTFIERLKNLYLEMYTYFIVNWYVRPIQEKYMHDNFGNVKRSINELTNNVSLMITTTDLATSYARPFQPNTINVGPTHLKKHLDLLPKDIQKWMDESEDGVICFSLGSNMQGTSVPEHVRNAFIETFKKFPKFRVIWKWEADTKLPGQPENVLVKKWFPQQSILGHPKLRLFISQIGLRSFEEAIYYGVPMLAVPLFGDQHYNAKKLITAGIGLSVEFESITNNVLYYKIKELLTNQSYKTNMVRQSSITRDTRISPVDHAVWWVEYVLRHNGAIHLRPRALDLTWYQYYMLDILCIIVILITVCAYIIYLIVRKIIKSSINMILLSKQSNGRDNKMKRQ